MTSSVAAKASSVAAKASSVAAKNGDFSHGWAVLPVRGSQARLPGHLPAHPRHALPRFASTAAYKPAQWSKTAQCTKPDQCSLTYTELVYGRTGGR